MSRFPDEVITAMHHAGTTVTCMSVQIDAEQWQAALFFVLPEHWTEQSSRAVFLTDCLLPMGLEADIHEQQKATLISLAIEIIWDTDNKEPPLQGEVLFIPGHLSSHFDTVKSLSEQPSLPVFIGDKHCNLVHQQTIPLQDEHRRVFADLLKEATSRDALLRFRGQYDPDAAFTELTRTH